MYCRGGSRIFLGGGALVSFSTSIPINHIFFCFFFCRIPVVLENRRSSQGGGGGGPPRPPPPHPLHPPPRSAPVLNNGFTTDIFFGKRWVRQGDHFSSLLFILALETLVSQSRENRNTKGFFINGKEFKTTLFHDDMTCFLRDTNSYFRLLKSLKKILPDTQAFV